MLLTLVILLSIFLTTSIIGNILLWKAGERHLAINELYTKWIINFRNLVFKTYAHMKLLDDKQMFEKDDEVGVLFQDMLELIISLKDKTEETTDEEE